MCLSHARACSSVSGLQLGSRLAAQTARSRPPCLTVSQRACYRSRREHARRQPTRQPVLFGTYTSDSPSDLTIITSSPPQKCLGHEPAACGCCRGVVRGIRRASTPMCSTGAGVGQNRIRGRRGHTRASTVKRCPGHDDAAPPLFPWSTMTFPLPGVTPISDPSPQPISLQRRHTHLIPSQPMPATAITAS